MDLAYSSVVAKVVSGTALRRGLAPIISVLSSCISLVSSTPATEPIIGSTTKAEAERRDFVRLAAVRRLTARALRRREWPQTFRDPLCVRLFADFTGEAVRVQRRMFRVISHSSPDVRVEHWDRCWCGGSKSREESKQRDNVTEHLGEVVS
jgi:hypothetical protein